VVRGWLDHGPLRHPFNVLRSVRDRQSGWLRPCGEVYVGRMGAALGWGFVAASSLIIGAVLGLLRSWPSRWIGVVLAFGAGGLISAVSFDLAEEGASVGSGTTVALGLAAGALTYFVADRLVEHQGSKGGADADGGGGTALALGAFLDG